MKTIFLDRDGVISQFTPNDYVKTWNEFRFLPGALRGLGMLFSHGYRIVVISNQAGVSKGIFSMENLNDITLKMEREAEKAGTVFAAVYYCIHAPEENCECRKPRPGLLQRAKRELGGIIFGETFFVGDTDIDIEAGKAAGTKTILVLSGKTRTAEETLGWKARPDFVASGLEEAAEIIISQDSAEKDAGKSK